jgi:hypothetical protein
MNLAKRGKKFSRTLSKASHLREIDSQRSLSEQNILPKNIYVLPHDGVKLTIA